VQAGGKRLPYAGKVPWADAVANPGDPRRITVMADGQRMHGTDTCVLPVERPVVRSTSATVSILVAGYGRPPPAGVACGEPGRGSQRVTVTLPSPLDRRALVDATTGLRHRVLDPAAVPNVSVAPGYVAAPISWQDRTGVVTRDWSSNACATDCSIKLLFAPAGSSARLDHFNGMSVGGHVSINGSAATIYKYRERRGQLLLLETAIGWTRPDGSRLVLEVGGGERGPHDHVPTRRQAIRLARAIK
jgi:hypothetical protein